MKKHNIISVFFTLLVIGLLILSGPAQAIDVSLTTPNIDLAVDNLQDVDFTIQVKINDGEFLPLMYTNLILDYGDGSLTCKINNDNTDDCDFLTVTKTIEDLNGGYGYGYGYGYSPNYGYGYDFGYGYGYSGSGTITYTLSVDISEIPLEFLNKDIDVEARVYGGNVNNLRYFRGTSSFNVNAEKETDIEITDEDGNPVARSVTYPNVIIDFPANSLSNDATITIRQVVPIDDTPTNTNSKLLGKVYDFSITGATILDNLRVTLTYTDDELGSYDESRIYPAFYNTVTNDWEQLIVLSRDPNNNELTFLTNHFTQFTLLADTSIIPVDGGGDTTGGGGGATPTRRISQDVIIPPTPELEEEIPGEVPAVTPGATTPAAPTVGLRGITGAVIGLLGTGGSIVVLILAICGVGFGGYFFVKKKKK